MSITIHSKTRYSQSFELTLECDSPELPATVQTVASAVVGQTGRAGGYNKDLGQQAGVIYATGRRFPPTLTLRAREKLTGLVDAVATAPEIVAAVKAGLVTVTKDGSSTPVKPLSKVADKSRG